MKVNMKDTEYYRSGNHSNNIRAAGLIAQDAHRKLRQGRIEEYKQNPTRCKTCDTEIEYDKRHNKFCSKSCSAYYNNKLRTYSEETKRKISQANTGKKASEETKQKRMIGSHCKVFDHTCSVCGKISIYSISKKETKTCGARECIIHASVGRRPYPNGKRKLFNYWCEEQKEEVVLESSWELDLAKWLDELNIKWIRPKHLTWNDGKKDRLYYPDFYLVDYDVYLDPKNPWAMENDKFKMKVVSKQVNIIYGDLETLKKKLLRSVGQPGRPLGLGLRTFSHTSVRI